MSDLTLLLIPIVLICIWYAGDWICYLGEYYCYREKYIIISFEDFAKLYHLNPSKWQLDCCCVYYITNKRSFFDEYDELIFIPSDFIKYKQWHRMIKAQNRKLKRQMEKEEKIQKQLRNQERYAEILKEMGE